METNIPKKNLAYKVVFIPNGLALLFSTFVLFEQKNIKVNLFQGNLFVELGDNVFMMTDRMLNHLIKFPKIYILKAQFSEYETNESAEIIDFSPDILAQIKGAASIIRKNVVDKVDTI